MKIQKTIGFFLTALLLSGLLAIPGAVSAENAPETVIPKVETPPLLDGKIGDGEYPLEIKNGFEFLGDTSPETHPAVYAAYDDQALYVACRIDCKEHLCEVEGDSYIFSKHHVMIALTPTAPTEDKYQPKSGGEWDWSEAYGSYLGREFSLACLQADGAQISSMHFPAPASYTGGWKTAVPDNAFRAVHTGDADIYEAAIPWDFIDPENQNSHTEGAQLGLSVCIGIGDVNADNAQFVQYGTGIASHKNFAEYRSVRLGGLQAAQTAGRPGAGNGEGSLWLTVTLTAAGCVAVAAIIAVVILRRRGKSKGENV